MVRNRRFAELAVLAVCAAMAGCAGGPQNEERMKLVRGKPFEPDLPIPAGFALVERASEDRSTGTTRLYLRHEYIGKSDKYSLRNFYREQMPLSRWTKVSDGSVKGVVTMRFEKGNECCDITITEEASAFSRKSRVQIVVAREERGQAPPTARTGS